ncbi:MAG: ABC transporter ATP-binding protein [Planctomycetota bacterium]
MSALIELDRITKQFGLFHALNNVSLTVQPGVTGLLGPNGAGKSTLIKILLGLLQPTSGTGRVLNHEIGKDARTIRSQVGYMPEDDCFLYGLSGIESVQFSAQLSGIPGVESLRRAHEILDYCGLEQERYRNVDTYSTGMRQKLRFAQAIVHDPPLLILDEPTSGLDPEEREIMLRRIQRLSTEHGKTVVICTHILPDVQAVSDSVVILANGSVRVADNLQSLSKPTEPTVMLRVLGPPDDFLIATASAGLESETMPDGRIVVRGEVDDLSNRIWQLARDNNVVVRSLAPSRNSLEEIFISAVQGTSNGR